MNRRGFLSSLVAATSAIVGVSVGARALPQQAPIPIPPSLFPCEIGEWHGMRFHEVPWKHHYRTVNLNEEWMTRIGENMRDTIERNDFSVLT